MRLIPRAPTINDSRNVVLGDFWLDTATDTLYQLVSLANDVAAWNEVATPAGVGTSYFDTDAGTAQDLNQRINLVGGANINTTGAGSTVTVILDNDVNLTGGLTAVTDISTSTGDFVAQAGNFIATHTAGASGNVALFSDSVDTVSSQIGLSKSRGAGAIAPNDVEGLISFAGFDGANYIESARIQSTVPATSTVAANRVAGALTFFTHPDSVVAASARMEIQSAGRVVISSADAGVDESLFVGKTFSSTYAVTLGSNGNNADPIGMRTTKSRAGGAVQTGDELGFVSFEGSDGTNQKVVAQISANVPAGSMVAAGRVAGNLDFFTSPDAVAAAKLRLTIDEDGQSLFYPADNGGDTLVVQGTRALQGITAGFTGTEWVEGQNSLQTVGAAATEVLAIPIGEGAMILIKAQVSGFQDDFTDSIVADVFFGVYRPTAGNVTLIVLPAPPVPKIFTTSTTTVDNVVDVGTQEARITVAGVALETFNWVCKYSYMYLVDNL
jgi:hypothetical protein